MKTIASVALTALLLAAPCATAGGDTVGIRVMSYNVKEGLGPTGGNFYNDIGSFVTTLDADGPGPNSGLNPDIIVLNELDDQNRSRIFTFVNQFLPGYQVITESGDNFNYNAIVYGPRATLLDADILNTSGPRDVIRATFQVEDAQKLLTVYGAHLRCCSSGSAGRTQEALNLGAFIRNDRDLGLDLDDNGIREHENQTWAVLLGDLNEDNLVGAYDGSLDGLFDPTVGLVDFPVESLFGAATDVVLVQRTFFGSTNSRLDYLLLDEDLAVLADTDQSGDLSQAEINAVGFVYRSADAVPGHAAGQFANGNATATSNTSDHLPIVFDLSLPRTIPACAGDADGDGSVNLTDLNAVLAQFGTVAPGQTGDFDGNGIVDLADLNTILMNFGCMP